jgi:thymidine phosphorylase
MSGTETTIGTGDGPVFLPQTVIRKKRDNGPLSEREIEQFVNGAVTGAVSEGQIGAFTMAVYLNGMTTRERVALALAMRDSGSIVDWSRIGLSGRTIIDKHSSGGVGDEKVSLLVAPLVAACGIHMPMISARGLGHTGGEIDLLAAIPGYDIAPPSSLFMTTVRDVGCAIIGPTDELAPADLAIFKVRDVSATVESIPLITGSIMSKKLAAGINGLVMTVPFGTGAFMQTEERARELASSLIEVAAGIGVPLVVLISDLTQVLGDAVGSAPQIREIVDFLTGDRREPRLLETVLAISSEALVMGGISDSSTAARNVAQRRLEEGAAADRFARMVALLGGPSDLVERPESHLATAPVHAPVYPGESGIVQEMDCYAIGMAMVSLGAGRSRPDDAVDVAVGLSGMAQVGATVGPGRPLCVIHARDRRAWDRAAESTRVAVRLGSGTPPSEPVIRGRLTTP